MLPRYTNATELAHNLTRHPRTPHATAHGRGYTTAPHGTQFSRGFAQLATFESARATSAPPQQRGRGTSRWEDSVTSSARFDEGGRAQAAFIKPLHAGRAREVRAVGVPALRNSGEAVLLVDRLAVGFSRQTADVVPLS